MLQTEYSTVAAGTSGHYYYYYYFTYIIVIGILYDYPDSGVVFVTIFCGGKKKKKKIVSGVE